MNYAKFFTCIEPYIQLYGFLLAIITYFTQAHLCKPLHNCVGCPCNSKALQELEIAKQYEPNKVKAAYAVFGKSYEYREAYNRFKKTGGKIDDKTSGKTCDKTSSKTGIKIGGKTGVKTGGDTP